MVIKFNTKPIKIISLRLYRLWIETKIKIIRPNFNRLWTIDIKDYV